MVKFFYVKAHDGQIVHTNHIQVIVMHLVTPVELGK